MLSQMGHKGDGGPIPILKYLPNIQTNKLSDAAKV